MKIIHSEIAITSVDTSSDTDVLSLPIQVDKLALNCPLLKFIGVILASRFKCAPNFLNLKPVITWPVI